MKIIHFIILLFIGLFACQSKIQVDLIVHNGIVYTVDKEFSTAQAFAVKNGKFVEIGKNEDIQKKYISEQVIDAEGKAIYPGFIDAHCHFYRYGEVLLTVDLVGAKSYQETLERIQTFRTNNPKQSWIKGHGWDQNDWADKAYPNKAALDSLFPDTPVFLTRVDGHAALVNQKALDLAKITPETPQVEGGVIEQIDGKLTGILVDNAKGLVGKFIPEASPEEMEKILFEAQERCFAVGLTSVQDAGLPRKVLDVIDQMNKEKILKMRVYAMVGNNAEDVSYYLDKGAYKTEYLSIRSVKLYADGALGSRGACLLDPYQDEPLQNGFLLSSPAQMAEWIDKIAQKGFQINTHCIGDSANRTILDLYAKHLKGKNDLRWRIEHAQVLSPEDFDKFGKYAIIPSVQPTHATSDMFWALDRLGKERLRDAYAYQDLLKQNNMLALGSDFPVEDINPLYGFHAAVARKDAQGNPVDGFQMENALSREHALRGMTIWAAYAAFEEKEKGSIETGKLADFVILEKDILKIPVNETRDTKIVRTFLGGKVAYNPIQAGK
jgi:hypothetical protein